MVSAKGKEKVNDSGGKGGRKWSAGADDDKTGRKRKNRSGALRFFDDTSYEVDKDSDVSDGDDDDMFDFGSFEEEFPLEPDNGNESGKAALFSFIPKEEVMSEEEFERMMEERYKSGADFVTHTEDTCDRKRLFEGNMYVPSAKDPTIWKVKCMVGRERYSAFCLMQKYVDLKCLGTKLQIISAFAPDHIKGFIFIEADKQSDIYEACKGLCTVYSTKSAPLPNNEMSQLLSVRSKSCGISKGMWARVKSGKYKGDLAMVVAVNDSRKKVTAKLIPRIDLKAMAGKFGGGIAAKRTAVPAQRLISSSELEEFRPLIQYRRDRDTNEMFEFLDGMMLKDGYIYKKIPIDSLNYWGVVPTKDELLKFESSKKDESTDVQWLSQLFGEKKKQKVEDVKQDKGGGKSKGDKGGGKSKGSSSSDVGTSFMHDLVFFGRRDFGVVIGSEKGDSVKVIKEGSEGPTVVTVKESDLKSASFDKKLFSVLDHHSNTVSINDCVRVLEGPLKDKQGIVKKIYKGILFLCDESEQENDGYICIKGQLCEKVNSSGISSNAKGSEPGSSSFMDLPSSPKSPLSPSKSWQEKDDKSNFKREENGMFSVGQSLRIRVGPLKGYLCRVLAIRRSGVTVKLDSQKKILTVKCEHLSEVRGRNPAISQGEDSGAVKPFDFLQTLDGASDWMDGATLSTEGNNWNAGGSTERSSWSSLPSSDLSLTNQPGAVVPVAGDAMKEDSGWPISNQNSSWGAVSVGEKTVPDAGPVDGWGTGSGWKQASSSTAVGIGTSASWGKSVEPHHDNSHDAEKNESWGKAAEKWSSAGDNCGSKVAWGASDVSSDRQSGGWGDGSRELNKPEASSWKKDKFALTDSAVVDECKWGNQGDTKKNGVESWGKSGSTRGEGRESEPEGPSKKNQERSQWNLSEKRNNESASTENHCDTKKDGVEGWGKSGSTWGKGRESELEGPSTKCQEQSQWILSEKWNDKSASTGNNADIAGSSREWVNLGSTNISDSQTKNWDTKMVCGIATVKGQADGWSKPKPVGVDVGPSWKPDSKHSWGKKDDCWGKSNEGKDKESGWKQGSDGNKDAGGGNEWDSTKRNEDDKPSGWNLPNVSNNSVTSDWGKASSGNVDSWNKEKKPNGNNKSSWATGNTSFDGQSSDWSSVSQDKAKDGQVSSWKSENNVDGGSSTGWGQSNWLKGETRDTGGNLGSSWSGKSNWNSGNGTDRSNNLDDMGDRGRGGNWRGRGGRGDRGGFRGRGGSGRGDFGGSDTDRAGFESRWGSDRGGIGARGRSNRDGGFRGRGGFRGSGRGDWKNSGGDLREEKHYGWNKGSNSDSEGWKNSGSQGSWNWGDKENNQGTNQNPSTEWNKPSGNSEMDTWQSKESNKGEGQSDSWGKAVSTSWETASQSEYSRWSKTEPSNENKTKESTKDKEPSDSWGKAVVGSRETAPENASSFGNWNRPEASDGGQTKVSAKDTGPSDSWGKAAASSWGDGSSKGGWL
ncbi:protein RNA-directed DNA methylation 3-like [Primulina tabacum]|uniref:protein RNA-directed DNA methylation 3-like n=1 Tax=Primulina tabacum TaxID=48773 RepID=UPI003F59CD07